MNPPSFLEREIQRAALVVSSNAHIYYTNYISQCLPVLQSCPFLRLVKINIQEVNTYVLLSNPYNKLVCRCP